ncbi:MAG: hypothetical protein HC875_06640 [Anaerolineales bacterium]|nr:hypothetical protein [Anaerolineales bacterium]
MTQPTLFLATALAQVEPPSERLVNGLTLLVVLVISGVTLAAFITLLAALLPGPVTRSQTVLLHSPWRAFWLGLVNYLFLGGISLALLSTEIQILVLAGLLLATFLTVVTGFGLAGLARLTGERLAGLRNTAASPWQALLWGTITVELAALLPFLGWFVLTPILLMLSFGAAVLGWRSQKVM